MKPKFQPYYPICRTKKLTWETCHKKYCCDMGEECWFGSEDYHNDGGKGSRVKKTKIPDGYTEEDFVDMDNLNGHPDKIRARDEEKRGSDREMKDIFPNPFIFFISIFAIMALAVFFTFCTPVDGNNYLKSAVIGHDNFIYIPHYVKIHIMPEEENVAVAAWASDKLPPTTGYTDKNSDVVFELLSVEKYNIWIPERKFSVYIYPQESEYIIDTEKR